MASNLERLCRQRTAVLFLKMLCAVLGQDCRCWLSGVGPTHPWQHTIRQQATMTGRWRLGDWPSVILLAAVETKTSIDPDPDALNAYLEKEMISTTYAIGFLR